MEVHHPHHIHKKKITEYFLEFLMLFFAVSLGFFAENIRDGYIEKERAHELALALYADIKNDEEKMHVFVDSRTKILNDIKEIILNVDANGIIANDPRQYRLFARSAFYWSYFEPKTANLDQIINSGSLRYFKKKGLVETISKYKSSIISLLNRQEREKVFFYTNLQPFIINEIDLKPMDTTNITGEVTIRTYFDKIDSGLIKLPHSKLLYVNTNKDSVHKITNMYRFYSIILTTSSRNYYSKYLEDCKNLIESLKEEIE